MASRWAARWSLTNEHSIQHNTRLIDIHANLGAAAKILRFGLQSAVLGIGAYLVVADQASGGIMIAFAILMGRALAPVEVALTSWRQFIAAREELAACAPSSGLPHPAGARGYSAAPLLQPDS